MFASECNVYIYIQDYLCHISIIVKHYIIIHQCATTCWFAAGICAGFDGGSGRRNNKT